MKIRLNGQMKKLVSFLLSHYFLYTLINKFLNKLFYTIKDRTLFMKCLLVNLYYQIFNFVYVNPGVTCFWASS